MSTTLLDAINKAGQDKDLLPSTVENICAWIKGDFLPAWAISALDELVGKKAWEELNDRFFKNMAFGTGGMRGRTIGKVSASAETGTLSPQGTPAHPAVGSNYLNDFNITRATIGLFRYCEYHNQNHTHHFDVPKLVIAHDVRHFSRHFCELAASTWTQLGGKALIFDGPRSTPQLSFTVRHTAATAGIVITASHNPPHDNGFKVYFKDGGQVVSPHAEGIIDEVNKVQFNELPQYLNIDLEGVGTLPESIDEAYIHTLKEQLLEPEVIKEQRPKVVFTPIHGTGGIITSQLLKDLGVDLEVPDAQNKQDPRFPTVTSPNPENAEALEMAIEQAKASGADLVAATDPDADRMGVAVRTEEGKMQLLSGNMIGSLLAEARIQSLKSRGWIPEAGSPNAALIKTFVTTPLQEAIAKGHGLKIIDTLTGFKWIGEKLNHYERQLKERLLEQSGIAIDYDATPFESRFKLLLKHSTAYVFGGEESYGYLASDTVRDKDANAAVILFCELAAQLKKEGKTFGQYLNELYLKYGYYQESLVNIYMEGAAGAQQIKNILESYRSSPPTSIGDIAISGFKDFGRETFHDADGKPIPSQDFYFVELANGYRYAVRGSGTEPKIKFYIFAQEAVKSLEALEGVKGLTGETLNTIGKAIEADALSRAK